jgi:hypothetical protein
MMRIFISIYIYVMCNLFKYLINVQLWCVSFLINQALLINFPGRY